jgi:flagellar basal-body rod protein FlgB
VEIPYFAALKAKLDHLGVRQRLLAENIANATTPGFVPRDAAPADFDAIVRGARAGSGHGVNLARTQAGHLAPRTEPQAWQIRDAPDSETTIDGNQVVLEDETLKAGQVQIEFDTAIGLYQKGLQLLRTAARAPPR